MYINPGYEWYYQCVLLNCLIVLANYFYQDFGRIVKFYNRIATALVKFENLWLSLWKSGIENACSGLKVSLLAYHPETRQLVVNANGR